MRRSELYTEDIVFYEPSKNAYCGRDEIKRIAGTLRPKHPDFRHQPLASPEEVGNREGIQRLEGPPRRVPRNRGY